MGRPVCIVGAVVVGIIALSVYFTARTPAGITTMNGDSSVVERGPADDQADQTLPDRSSGRPVRNPPSTKMQSPVT